MCLPETHQHPHLDPHLNTLTQCTPHTHICTQPHTCIHTYNLYIYLHTRAYPQLNHNCNTTVPAPTPTPEPRVQHSRDTTQVSSLARLGSPPSWKNKYCSSRKLQSPVAPAVTSPGSYFWCAQCVAAGTGARLWVAQPDGRTGALGCAGPAWPTAPGLPELSQVNRAQAVGVRV